MAGATTIDMSYYTQATKFVLEDNTTRIYVLVRTSLLEDIRCVHIGTYIDTLGPRPRGRGEGPRAREMFWYGKPYWKISDAFT